ncbi:uncharacterized protein LOC123550358 [Mercenaria mercenaria]|uniref:uncharacterized protein LOC123550358 n=1 Tax=Mercenaria mercenaria TaxID=6596 RepID=UPI00234E51A2|nr:uncharacterized protein LOC123550358 [Mercenaria mercenaria]
MADPTFDDMLFRRSKAYGRNHLLTRDAAYGTAVSGAIWCPLQYIASYQGAYNPTKSYVHTDSSAETVSQDIWGYHSVASVQASKEKYDNNKKTGGGPAISLSPTEELIINHLLMNNKSQMTGLEGGVDSLIPSSTNQVSQLLPQSKHVTAANKETTCITFQEVFEGDNVIDSNNTTAVTAPIIDCTGDACTETSENETGRKHFLYFSNTKKNKTGKRKQDDKEDDLYALEKKRICKEIDLLEQRKAQEHELFLLQKRIFLKQLDEYTE